MREGTRIYKVLVPLHGGGHPSVKVKKLSGPMVQNRIIPAGSVVEFTGDYDESNLIKRGIIESTKATAKTDAEGEEEAKATLPKHSNPIPTGDAPAGTPKSKEKPPKHANPIPVK